MRHVWTAAALLLLALPLALPSNLAAAGRADAWGVPMEWPLLVLALVLLPGRAARLVAVAAGALLAFLVAVRIADTAMIAAFGRYFDFGLDMPLVGAGWNLLSGSVGRGAAALAFAAAILVFAALAALFAAAARRVATARGGEAPAMAGAAALLAATALPAAFTTPAGLPITPGFFAARDLAVHWSVARRSAADIAAFRGEAAEDPRAGLPSGPLLGGLGGKDVLLVFVESYGRSAVEKPLFAGEVGEALAAAEAEMREAGLAMASGWLTSTTVGGQSWLAHATALSGLRIDSQRRYDRLVAGDRPTLVADFAEAGWRTAAIVPAITMDWPEGGYFGYDSVLDAHGLGYAGLPFNWVTMPDQYTLEQVQRAVRGRADRPVFAEIALISSHAPWTPIPPLVAWEAIGDGSVFDPFATAGERPEVLWRDMDKVRVQYRRSLDYVLRTIASFAARYGGDDLVMIVLGDHPAAPAISGDPSGRDVPLHVVSGDQRIVAAARGWGLSAGMVPAPGVPSIPMQDLRRLLLATFTHGDAAGAERMSAAPPAEPAAPPQSIR